MTYGELTRSTEEEHQQFMKALRMLMFTEKEFLEHGPAIVLKKYEAFMEALIPNGGPNAPQSDR